MGKWVVERNGGYPAPMGKNTEMGRIRKRAEGGLKAWSSVGSAGCQGLGEVLWTSMLPVPSSHGGTGADVLTTGPNAELPDSHSCSKLMPVASGPPW